MTAGTGKDTAHRPKQIDDATMDDNWARIFGRKADQAYVEQTRQDNLAAANRNTEQDAKDG